MVSIDYMAHQEQYAPPRLLELATRADDAGFETIWTSDHFHPWFHTEGEAGFAWSWLGAATQLTARRLGTCVTPATGHYHPGLIAQAFATLDLLHDGDIVIGLSTGEAMNSKPLGLPWPEYPERRERLKETLEIVHRLFEVDGFVTYGGEHFQLDEARLYSKPAEPPELHVAANGPGTGSLAGRHCDGLITVLTGEDFTDRLYPAVRGYAEEAGRDPDVIETTLLLIASYDPDYERALESTRPWHATTQDVFDRGLSNPKAIEAVGREATRAEIEQKFLIADDPSDIAAELERLAEQGYDRIAIGNTSPDPERFFDVMADEVIGSV